MLSKKMLIPVILLMLVGAADALAEKIEIQPFIGYRFGNSLDVDPVPFEGELYDEFKIDDGMAYGASFGYFVNPKISVEFAWSAQSGALTATAVGGTEREGMDVAVHNFHGNFLYHFGDPDSGVRPYLLGGVGATWYDPETGNGSTRFSTNWGAGVKINASDHLGLRFQGRWIPTYIGTDDEAIICNPWGCWVVGDAVFHHQFELSAGVTLRF